MSILDRLAALLGYAKALPGPDAPNFISRTFFNERYDDFRTTQRDEENLYRLSSWLRGAVQVVAQVCATTAFNVHELQGEDKTDIVNHPFELLLRRPNPIQSRFEFIEATVAYKKITGDVFWYLNSPTPGGAPAELYVLGPDRMRVQPSDKLEVLGYYYDPGDGSEVVIDAANVVHFTSFNPASMFHGLSIIEALGTVARGDLDMQQWNGRLFGKNNARLPGVLAFADPINDSDWKQILADTDASAAKRQMMMLRGAGKGGVQWMPIAQTLHDMEFVQGRTFTKEEIYSVVAPGLASVLAVNATEANSRAGMETLTRIATWPELVSLSEKITNDILPRYGDNLVGDFDDIRLKDRAVDLQEQVEYAKSHTIDEIRREYYGDDELGDPRGALLPVELLGKAGANVPVPTAEPVVLEPADQAMQADLSRWKTKALKSLERGRGADVPFESEVIPLSERSRIHAGLQAAGNASQVKAVFETPRESMNVADLVTRLEQATRTLRWRGYP